MCEMQQNTALHVRAGKMIHGIIKALQTALQNKMEPNKCTPCSCWNDYDIMLREKGFKVSNACSAMNLSGGNLTVKYYLPIQPVDRGMKHSDPKGVEISHCPFCGQRFESV